MSDDFENAIKDIASRNNETPDGSKSAEASSREVDKDFNKVLDEFLKISKQGVDIYNESANHNKLAIYDLPAEFLEIFLGIPGRRGGLAIVSPGKLAVFFDEDPDMINKG